MGLDDPTEQLRFRVGVGVIALAVAPVLAACIRLADGDRLGSMGWLALVTGVVLSTCGAVLAGRGMPGRVGPPGWRRLGVGAAVAAPGIGLMLFVQNTMGG